MLEYKQVQKNVFLVISDSKSLWKCNGLLIKNVNRGEHVLIDCNFEEDEIISMKDKLGGKIIAYIVTHVHLDHVTNIHFYEKMGIKILCSEPEKSYLSSLESLLEEFGTYDFKIADLFIKYINSYTNWNEIKNVIGFNQNKVFDFQNFRLTAIHLPGHSPGHVGFKIESKERNNESKDVLFTADIGLDKFGPWYGLKNSSIKEYLSSIKKIDKIYQSKDWIITSSHEPIFRERNPHLFLDLLEKIKNTKQKLINFILNNRPANLEDLVFQGIYYRKKSMSKLDPLSKKIYFFWEAFIIFNLFKEFATNNGLNLFKTEINQDTLMRIYYILKNIIKKKRCYKITQNNDDFYDLEGA